MTRDPDLSALAQRGAAPAVEVRKPSGIATGLAATLPFVVGLLATIVFVVGLGREPVWPFLQETGWPFYAIILTAWFSALVLTVTLVLAGRGMRVPTAMSLFFAGLPWIVGVAGARLSTSTAIDAVSNADAAMRATMLAQGIAEASGARLLGAWCTSALAGALALGLGIAALGQRSTNRKPLFGAVGFALALPILALAGYAVVSRMFGAYSVYGVVAALGVLVALTLAAAGSGDSVHGRAASLSAAVVPVAFISFVAAVAAMETGGFREAFRAVASADPSMKAMLLAEGAESFVVGGRITGLTLAALGLAALILAGWAVSRARPSIGTIIGGAAVVFAAVLVVGADIAADVATEHDVAAMMLTPWHGVEGFSPAMVGMTDEPADGPPVAVITTDRILPFGGQPIPVTSLGTPAGRTAVAEALRTALARLEAGSASDGPDTPDWLRERPTPDDGRPFNPPATDAEAAAAAARAMGLLDELLAEPAPPNPRPSMALAIDARVPASVLRQLMEAARTAGARSLVLVGTGARVTPEAMTRLEEQAPLIAAISQSVGGVTVLLESAVSAGYADVDPLLWHATVTGRAEGQLTTRTGTGRAPMAIPGERADRWSRRHRYGDEAPAEPRPIAYLALADDATSESLAVFAEAAMAASLQPLVLVGAVPGRPEQPLAPSPSEGFGGLGLGRRTRDGGGLGTRDGGGLGALGLGGGSGYGNGAGGFRGGRGDGNLPQIRTGDADVRGSLSREVIRRVIQRHIGEVRFCYERALQDRPTLAGRVNVQFVISPTGAVQTASIADSDLNAPAVDACIANAVRRWTFPAPEGGGIVVVTYPFTLQSGR